MSITPTPELFQPALRDLAQAEAIARPSTTYWQDAWRRLRKNRMAMFGLITIMLVTTICFVGPLLSPYNSSDQILEKHDQPPSREYWLGTDGVGRDLLVRVMEGGRISLAVGVVSGLIQFLLGAIYGAVAGLAGGRIDNLMMRIVDILDTIPLMIYVILLMVILGPGLMNIFIALGLVYWQTMARIVRAQVLSLKEQEFVLAARVLGANRWRILTRHLIPNAIGPIIVTMTLSIPAAIFTESFLSFIGLGVSAPTASWGTLASDGVQALRSYPWQLFFPAGAISLTMLAFNFLGDGLRDALDPRLRR